MSLRDPLARWRGARHRRRQDGDWRFGAPILAHIVLTILLLLLGPMGNRWVDRAEDA
jgi:hypothetical protein